MIEQEKGGEEEMMKLVNPMLNKPEIHKLIVGTNTGKAKNEDFSIELHWIISKSIKVGKVYSIKEYPRDKKIKTDNYLLKLK